MEIVDAVKMVGGRVSGVEMPVEGGAATSAARS